VLRLSRHWQRTIPEHCFGIHTSQYRIVGQGGSHILHAVDQSSSSSTTLRKNVCNTSASSFTRRFSEAPTLSSTTGVSRSTGRPSS
jgi:hypothetical protein